MNSEAENIFARKEALIGALSGNYARVWAWTGDDVESPLASGELSSRLDSINRPIYDIGPGNWIFRAEEVVRIDVRFDWFSLDEIDIYLG